MTAKMPIRPERQDSVYRKKDALIVSFEDTNLRNINPEKVDEIIQRGDMKGRFEKFINIILLRDPFNLIASRIRGGWDTEVAKAKAINLWKIHAREFLGETSSLQNKLLIKYNHWFSNEEYRKSISEQIGFPFTDDGKNILGYWGSSFDGKTYRNNANEMDVLERWKKYSTHEWFLNLCADPELIDLSKQIFEWCPKEIEMKIR